MISISNLNNYFAFAFHRHEDVDIIIIREQTEGEYTSLEHEVWEVIVYISTWKQNCQSSPYPSHSTPNGY